MTKRGIGMGLQSLLYLASGVNHFVHKGFYRHIMPDHYAHPDALIHLSGVAEIAGGLGLLVPRARRVAATGIGFMLLVFLDVHLYMLRHPERFPEVPVWVLWARLPLQAVLVAWAWNYARVEKPLQEPEDRV